MKLDLRHDWRHLFAEFLKMKIVIGAGLSSYLFSTIAAIVFENGDKTEPFPSSYDGRLPFLHVTKSA